MKLNNIKTLWHDAPINGKDVSWDFICEDLKNKYDSIAESKDGKRIALYEHDHLVELIHLHVPKMMNVIKVWSLNSQAREIVANKIAGWINANDSHDLYAEVKNDLDIPLSTCIYLYHTNTDCLKCHYTIKVDGKLIESKFFLDMLEGYYDGMMNEQEPDDSDLPKEHIFAYAPSTKFDQSEGYEIQIRLDDKTGEVTLADAYLWRTWPDGHVENYDTIDADITITNVDTNEDIYSC